MSQTPQPDDPEGLRSHPGPLSFEESFVTMAAEATEIAEFDATLADGLPDDDYT